MSRINAVIVAEGVSVDAFTGRVTAFNMLDSLFVPRVPAALPKLHIVVSNEREIEDERFFERVVIKTASGQEVAATNPVEVHFALRFHMALHTLWGVRFDAVGVFAVEVQRRPSESAPWSVAFARTLLTQLAPHPLMPVAKTA